MSMNLTAMDSHRRSGAPMWLLILVASSSVHLMVPGVHGEPFSFFGMFRRSSDKKEIQAKTTNSSSANASSGPSSNQNDQQPRRRVRRVKAKRKIADRQDGEGIRHSGGFLSTLAQLLPARFPLAGRLPAMPPLFSPFLPASFASPAVQAAALRYRYRPMPVMLPPMLPAIQPGGQLLGGRPFINSGLGRPTRGRKPAGSGQGNESSPSSSGAATSNTDRPKVRYMRLKKKRFRPSEISVPSASTTEDAVGGNRRRGSTSTTEASSIIQKRQRMRMKRRKKPAVPSTSRQSSSTGAAVDTHSPPSMASADGDAQEESAPSATAAVTENTPAVEPVGHSSPSDSSSSGTGNRKTAGGAAETRRQSTPSRYQSYYDKYDSKTSQPSKTTSGYFKNRPTSSSSSAADPTSRGKSASTDRYANDNSVQQPLLDSKSTSPSKKPTKKTNPDYSTTTVTGGMAGKPKTFNHHHYYFDTTSTSPGDRDDSESKESASSGNGDASNKNSTIKYSA